MEFNKEVGSFLKKGGVYITGGIIDSRKEEVIASFEENSFEIIEHHGEKGWNVFVCERK